MKYTIVSEVFRTWHTYELEKSLLLVITGSLPTFIEFLIDATKLMLFIYILSSTTYNTH